VTVYHKYGQDLSTTWEFSEIYAHYLIVVSKKCIYKLTEFHTLYMLILTELNFSGDYNRILLGDRCFMIPFPVPNPRPVTLRL